MRGQQLCVVCKLCARPQVLRPQVLYAQLFVYVPGYDFQRFSPIGFLGRVAAEHPQAGLLGADRDQEVGEHVNHDE